MDGPSGEAGKVLRQYRRAAGLTQEALAERAGYSVVYVSMLERGQRALLPATAEILADALALGPVERRALQEAGQPEHGAEGRQSLVGRDAELTTIEMFFSGQGRPFLLLAGEPGAGKTRLLREVARRGAARGMRVLEGGCDRRGGQEPYAPLTDALARYLRERDPAHLRSELDGSAWLRRVLPELPGIVDLDGSDAGAPGDWRLPGEAERRLVVQALQRFLTAVAGPAGTLLVLDDLQWASADALALLTSLTPAQKPVRVAIAYRDSELHAGHPLAGFLADLAQTGRATHVRVGPLSPAASAELMDFLLRVQGASGDPPDRSAALRERVLRLAGGVPFYLVSYAEAARAGLAGYGNDLPWDILQSVQQRIDALPPDARQVLEVAAVIGRQIPRPILAAVSGLAEELLIDTLEALRTARLLVEDGPDEYSFTHDVVREVVECDVSTARRALLHRRVGEELERRSGGEAVEALAYHFARSDDTSRALIYLERAGDSARARRASATAEGYYRELADNLERLGRDREAAEAREQLATVLAADGRHEPALEVLEEVATAYRLAGMEEAEGRAVAAIGRVHALRGTADEGIDRLEPMASVLRSPRALAPVHAALAPLYLARRQYQEQLGAAEAAARAARVLGDDALLAEAEVWRGCALNQLGRLEDGRRVQEEAVGLAEAAGDVVSLSHALNDLAFLSEIGGELTRSRRWKLRALALAERTGDPAAIANMAFRCGQNAFLSGNLPEARRYFEQSLKTARESGSGSMLPYPLFGLALLARSQEEWDAATTLAREALAAAVACGDEQAARAAHSLLAEYELWSGDAHAALTRLRPYDRLEDGMELRSVLPILAEAALAAGDLPAARDAAQRAVAAAEARGNRVAQVDALRVAALVTAQEGQPDEARRQLEDALAMARAMHYPWAEARLEALSTQGFPAAPRDARAAGGVD